MRLHKSIYWFEIQCHTDADSVVLFLFFPNGWIGWVKKKKRTRVGIEKRKKIRGLEGVIMQKPEWSTYKEFYTDIYPASNAIIFIMIYDFKVLHSFFMKKKKKNKAFFFQNWIKIFSVKLRMKISSDILSAWTLLYLDNEQSIVAKNFIKKF